MKVSIKALALTAGIGWALCVFLVGVANLIWSGYAVAFLDVVQSIYPGYAQSAGFFGVLVGTLYALVGAAVAGAVIGWLYNFFSPAEQA